MIAIRRALLSCSDKTGLDVFAKKLSGFGIELVASGGTAEFLAKQGLRAVSVEQFAGIREQLDGRVKTLHPKIHAGILAKREDAAHLASVGEQGLIDLVVVNLYPFKQTIAQSGVALAEAIEQIDIGGVALLRAAAKNFSGVGVVCNPAQYEEIVSCLQANQGKLTQALTRKLALEAFALTSSYDAAIAAYLSEGKTVTITLNERQPLRYGENPHQKGGWYAEIGPAWGLGTINQLQGKELSYNNLLDIDAALRSLVAFEEPTCAIIKHNLPCGLASASNTGSAYEKAYACDAESAFGGIVGFNRPINAAVAERLTATFLEVIVAPAVEPAALPFFKKKTNLRVVTVDWPIRRPARAELRELLGSWVLQDPDAEDEDPQTWRVATKRLPTQAERLSLIFAWKAAKYAKSNAVVLVKDNATVGIGQGQPSRVGSVRLAIEKAGANGQGTVAASDGFFPFPDGVESLAKAGVTAIVQPGGSIKDSGVIAAADAAKVAMLITGRRHFRH